MNLVSIIIFLIALSGFLVGIVLSYITPEEMKTGEKNLFWLKKGIWVVMFVIFNYYLVMSGKGWFLLIFDAAAVILFLIEFRLFSVAAELGNYLLLGIIYFFHADETFRLLLASLIFIYGFPAGSLYGARRQKIYK